MVIELKTGNFQPEYASKLNFYVALVDDMPRSDHHHETIGILICGTKNDRSVRYSLGRSTSPMAVAAYIYDKLPSAEQQVLPEVHIVAALEWADPEPDPLVSAYPVNQRPGPGPRICIQKSLSQTSSVVREDIDSDQPCEQDAPNVVSPRPGRPLEEDRP